MTTEKKPSSNEKAAGHTGCGLLIARLVAGIGGVIAMVLLLTGIVTSGRGWLTVLDGLFFLVLAATVGCRWIDQRSGFAVSDDGKSLTWADFWRYVGILVPTAVAAWVLANVAGNHLLGGGGGT
jgi:hypothetical protein